MRLIFVLLFIATSAVPGYSRYYRSGGGSHHPSSGHSGYGGGHSGYGGGTHVYSGSGTHVYSGSGTHGYSGSGTHAYPPSSGSGTHSYPPSSGLSGNTNTGNVRQTQYQHQQHTVVQSHYSPRTEVHHHYHYSPPQQIHYGSTFHPVYQGHPPVYIYEYRDSGSRFDNLLTGLALYNLGRNSHYHNYSPDRQYSSTPGEVCKLGISQPTGVYEETRIDCNLMSSFIWEDTSVATRNEQHVLKNTTEVRVTQTVNGTGNSSITTVTVTSNTVQDALQVKGPSIMVTPGMKCEMIRTVRYITVLRKPVDCELLQEYARSSLHRSVAQCLTPLNTIIFNFLIIYLVRYLG